jgi:pimeloyl-ACP methyl ester carboxylesterase
LEESENSVEMKLIKRILLGLLVVAILAAAGFVAWAETPLGPALEALAALESDSQVTVDQSDGFITFTPTDQPTTVGFIFYPGGRVDARSYAAPLREIASRGYLVILAPVRLNLAFFDINVAAPAFDAHPEIQHWAIGGHSLGGVAAALFARDHAQIAGLVFWASYPADDSLKESQLRVLSIYGTNDMAGAGTFDEKDALMPADIQYVVIEGGNHSQFGDYGFQPGDNEATISRADQQAQTVEAVVEFLETLESASR